MTNQTILKNDLPITKFDDDKLGRQKFALQMRKIIKNYKGKNKIVCSVGRELNRIVSHLSVR